MRALAWIVATLAYWGLAAALALGVMLGRCEPMSPGCGGPSIDQFLLGALMLYVVLVLAAVAVFRRRRRRD